MKGPTQARIRAHRRAHKLWNVLSFAAAIFAFLLLAGVLVVVIMLEVRGNSPAETTLLYILTGSFAGGAVLCGGLAALAAKGGERAHSRELDLRESYDSETSFFVGDGTLATFSEEGVRIHTEGAPKGDADVFVPYDKMRFFSVCTRTRPAERGVWSVVLEIPARYLAKRGREPRDGKPVLVQADAKERLYRTLARFGQPLLGETPPAEKRPRGKFARKMKFTLPDPARRKRAALFLGVGAVAIAAGALLAGLWNVSVGVIVAVFGAFAAVRAAISFARAKGTLAFYDEGVFWGENGKADSVFLKWSEIERAGETEKDGVRYLRFTCAYGSYHFPDPAGAAEYIRENFPEKCGEEACGN